MYSHHNIEQSIADELDEAFRRAFRQMAISGAPGDTMNISYDVQENTDFGKLLHKEGLWSLYTYKGLGCSLMYHLCRGITGIKQENFPVNPKRGTCTGCNLDAPDEIRGLWTLHNFDWVQEGFIQDV